MPEINFWQKKEVALTLMVLTVFFYLVQACTSSKKVCASLLMNATEKRVASGESWE
jgi:hypothetical protein